MKNARTCLRCQTRISEARPVYLILTGDARIIGPFHAGCAAAYSNNLRLLGEMTPTSDQVVGRIPTGDLYELPETQASLGSDEQ
jgi:hypothetical protein